MAGIKIYIIFDLAIMVSIAISAQQGWTYYDHRYHSISKTSTQNNECFAASADTNSNCEVGHAGVVQQQEQRDIDVRITSNNETSLASDDDRPKTKKLSNPSASELWPIEEDNISDEAKHSNHRLGCVEPYTKGCLVELIHGRGVDGIGDGSPFVAPYQVMEDEGCGTYFLHSPYTDILLHGISSDDIRPYREYPVGTKAMCRDQTTNVEAECTVVSIFRPHIPIYEVRLSEEGTASTAPKDIKLFTYSGMKRFRTPAEETSEDSKL